MVKSDDKKRARLNVIAHLLSQVPHKKLPSDAETLPKHRKVSKGLEPKVPLKFVPEAYLRRGAGASGADPADLSAPERPWFR